MTSAFIYGKPQLIIWTMENFCGNMHGLRVASSRTPASKTMKMSLLGDRRVRFRSFAITCNGCVGHSLFDQLWAAMPVLGGVGHGAGGDGDCARFGYCLVDCVDGAVAELVGGGDG